MPEAIDLVSSDSSSSSSSLLAAPPPLAPMPEHGVAGDLDGRRTRLHQLVNELVRTQNRRAMIEYLRLRRALR